LFLPEGGGGGGADSFAGGMKTMEQGLIEGFYGKLRKVNAVCATLAGIVLLFITFSIFVDVFLRYVFGKPTIWITEVSTYLFLYVIYLGTAYALQLDMHIKVTFFLDAFSKRTKRVIDLITSILATLFTVVLLWQTSLMTWSAIKGKWTSPTALNAPYMYIHTIMVIGSFLLLLSFVCNTILEFTGTQTEKAGSV
jgi:TRAP-type C4-dicarboxylate transport system permease small subunit